MNGKRVLKNLAYAEDAGFVRTDAESVAASRHDELSAWLVSRHTSVSRGTYFNDSCEKRENVAYAQAGRRAACRGGRL